MTIPEWTLHHLGALFPNCLGDLVAGLLASTPHFASYLFSVTCFLCSNTLAFPDDGQVPKWSAWKSTLEWGQGPAPFRENCEVLGPAAQYLLSLPTQHACALTEKRAQQFPAATPDQTIFHLGFHRWIALKITSGTSGVQMHSRLPCPWGLLGVSNGKIYALCQALTERAGVLALHLSFLYFWSTCSVCGFEMIMSHWFSSLVHRFLFLTGWIVCLLIHHLKKMNATCPNNITASFLPPCSTAIRRIDDGQLGFIFLLHSIRHITPWRECQFIAAPRWISFFSR